jgi:Flp pilus assembly pilin Flp
VQVTSPGFRLIEQNEYVQHDCIEIHAWASPPSSASLYTGLRMMNALGRLWEEDGQDIAEYAIMLAVILAIVVGTIRLIGSNANNVFSSVASAVQ